MKSVYNYELILRFRNKAEDEVRTWPWNVEFYLLH